MKRFLFLLIIFLLAFCSMANAEIGQETDKFTGGKAYYTIYGFGTNESVEFGKIIDGISGNYELSFSAKALLEEKYSNAPIEVKIDDKPVQIVEVKEVTFLPTDPFNKNTPCLISSEAIVQKNIVDQIKVAKRVALRVYKDKYSPVVVVLPDSVLAEWQQVINMEK